jgi:hypothetical protein
MDEPPDENEAFENLDEALDEVDAQRGFIGGPEGQRDLGSELVVDRAELQEAGAELDDPEQMALLDGGMDDPDGTGRRDRPRDSSNVGDEYVTSSVVEREILPFDDEFLEEEPVDPELEIVDVDPSDLEQVADDAPGPDSARW